MVHNEKSKRRIFRLEFYSSGRRIKNIYHTNEFYLSEEEVLKFSFGICLGLLSKYIYPVIKIYDDDKLFDIITISSCNRL